MTATPVIVDTDIGGDVGNIGGLSVACAYHRLGYTDLLGVTVVEDHSKSPGCADVIRKHMGLPAIPISKGGLNIDNLNGFAQDFTFVDYLYDNCPRDVGLASGQSTAVTVLRTLLAARASADVVLYAGGMLTNIDALLSSTADGISGLTGSQLAAAKVRKLVICAGFTPDSSTSAASPDGHVAGTPEWNLLSDPAPANRVAANWPTPITWVGIEIGDTFLVGDTLSSVLASDDPRRLTYEQSTPDRHVTGRYGWDELGQLVVAEGDDQGFRTVRGSMAVNASTGANTWTPSADGAHRYVVSEMQPAFWKAHINALLTVDPSASPVLSTWPAAGAAVRLVFA